MALNFPTDTSSPYTDPTSGVKYIYNPVVGAWESAIQPPAVISASTPTVTIDGFLWWNTGTNELNVYEGGSWRVVQSSVVNTISVSSTAPSSPTNGQLWWDTVGGSLFLYYNDGSSAQWIETSPASGISEPTVTASNSAPTSPSPIEGDVWFNTLENVLYIFTSSNWVEVTANISSVQTVTGTAPITIGGTASDPVIGITSASNADEGSIRIGTQSEVNNATNTNVALTPGTLASGITNYLPESSDTVAGIIECATQAETEAGTNSTKAVTPESLALSIPNLGIGNPSGMVITFAGNTAPTGYLACDGSAVSRTTYSDLFAVCGTIYGVGDGSTTFNLPDLRGEFVRGWDDGRGVDSGRSFASIQLSANLQHNHGVTDPGHDHSQTGGSPNDDGGDHVTGSTQSGTLTNINTATTGISIDNDGGSESRPRNIALLYCIKT